MLHININLLTRYQFSRSVVYGVERSTGCVMNVCIYMQKSAIVSCAGMYAMWCFAVKNCCWRSSKHIVVCRHGLLA